MVGVGSREDGGGRVERVAVGVARGYKSRIK